MHRNVREEPREDFQTCNAKLQEETKIEALQQCQLFRELSVDDIKELSCHAITVHYKKSVSIFEEGSSADFFYVVQDGLVKVYKSTSSGKVLTFNVAGRGDTLNATAVSGDNYFMSAQTLNDVTVLKIGRKPYHTFLSKHSSIALELIGILSRRLNRECDRVVRLLGEDVEQRLIISLVALARKVWHQPSSDPGRTGKLCRNYYRDGYQSIKPAQEAEYHWLCPQKRRDTCL